MRFFFPVWHADLSHAVDFFARPGTRATTVSPPVLSPIRSPPFLRRVGREFLRDGVGRDRQRTATRGGPVLATESLATSIGLRTAARQVSGGFCRDRWSIYGVKKSPDRVGDHETRTIGLLPSRLRLGNYAKFALLFSKLPKIQTPNAKPFDTSFCDFLSNYKNANLLEMRAGRGS